MSRFFETDLHSDSDSSSSSDEQEVRAPQPRLTAAVFAFSDDEEDVKRVVRSAKEKRYEEMQTAIKNIKNCRKNRDVVAMLTNFEDLWKAFVKAHNVILKEEGGQIPRFYIRCLAEGEDFVNQLWDDRNARKNLSKNQSKSFATLRQKLRKYNRGDQMSAEIAKFRENPDLPDEEEEKDEQVSQDDQDSDDDVMVGKMGSVSVKSDKEKSHSKGDVGSDSQSESDADSTDWGSSGSASTSSDDDQSQYTSMREYFLKKTTDKDEDDRKRQRKEERDRARMEERDRRRRAEDEEDDEDGFEKVKKGAQEKIKLFAKDAEITLTLVNRKFQEINASRGKRSNNRRVLVELLHELLVICEQHKMSTAMVIKIKFGLIAAVFDYNMAARQAMRSELWQKALSCVDDLLDHLLKCTEVGFGEEVVEENESLDQEPYLVRGCVLSVLERLDDEFVKQLKDCDAHSSQYVTRLRDEQRMCGLIDKTIRVLESRLENADSVACQRFTSPLELCRAYLKRVEHLYFKVDEQVFLEDEGSRSDNSEPTSAHHMDTLCKYIYAKDTTAVLRTRAILFHIYHHAIHDHWYRARDLMLMSHLQTTIQNADVLTKTFYNRTMVQLGLCAFRRGHIREAHNALLEVQSSPRVKELLAQGSSQRRDELSAEQEELNKQRELPFHMHINLELLECVYLVSAMLIEVPYMAAHELNARRRLISKSFHYQLRNSALKHDLIGPPELMREHVVAASKAMRRGDWLACRDFIVNKTMNAKVWDRFYCNNNERADRVRALVTRKIQEETLRAYLFTYSHVYDSIGLQHLSEWFQLEQSSVHGIVSKMIIGGELMASLHEPSQSAVMHRTEPSRLQSTALQLADKLATFVENNDRLLDMKMGNDPFHSRGAGQSATGGMQGGGGQQGRGVREWGRQGRDRYGDRRAPRRTAAV